MVFFSDGFSVFATFITIQRCNDPVSIGSHSWIAQGDMTLTQGLDLVHKEQRRSGILTLASELIKGWTGGRLDKKSEQTTSGNRLSTICRRKTPNARSSGSGLRGTDKGTWLDSPIPSHSVLRKSQRLIRDNATVTAIKFYIILWQLRLDWILQFRAALTQFKQRYERNWHP